MNCKYLLLMKTNNNMSLRVNSRKVNADDGLKFFINRAIDAHLIKKDTIFALARELKSEQ